jgi:hypothetical protein
MRLIVSLLTAVCFIAAAEASSTGVATPQSQAAPSAPSLYTPPLLLRTPTRGREAIAPKPGTIDIIRQPSLLRQKLAGNCTTTCQWIGRQQFCNTHCF